MRGIRRTPNRTAHDERRRDTPAPPIALYEKRGRFPPTASAKSMDGEAAVPPAIVTISSNGRVRGLADRRLKSGYDIV